MEVIVLPVFMVIRKKLIFPKGRIYPYYLLVKLYAEPEFYDAVALRDAAKIVLTKEPKVPSAAIKEMRREVENIVSTKIEN